MGSGGTSKPAAAVVGAPVIDLFAGAGGLSLAVSKAGGDVRLMVDNDAVACNTLRANGRWHTGHVLEADVAKLSGRDLRVLAGLDRSDPLIVVGGAPCQPFSKAAYWTDPGHDAAYRRQRTRGVTDAQKPGPITIPRPDDRRSLVSEFLRLTMESRADAFLFENVPSITHPRNRRLLDEFIEGAADTGYKVRWFKLKAVEHGVPQLRERVFVLGSRRTHVDAPSPTHSAPGTVSRLREPVTAGSALRGLDAPTYFEPEELVSGRWADHLFEVPPGWNYKHHTAWAGHPSPTFETETRFWNFLLKLSPDLPSWTLAAAPGPWTGPFHWSNRRLRTVELAALQTFPRSYVFTGSRRERVRQIGNAVPVRLGQRVFKQLVASFDQESPAKLTA